MNLNLRKKSRFDFVQSESFRKVLERDYEEVTACLDAKSYKAVMVMSGSIVEALLLEFLLINKPKGYSETKIKKLRFVELIDLAYDSKLISNVTKDLASVIREYRNFVHPDKEVRTNELISEDQSVIAFRLLNLIIKEVSNSYPILYGARATDVFRKLKDDQHFKVIFPKILNTLNQSEKNKLLTLFIKYYLNEKGFDFSTREFVEFGFNALNNEVSSKVHQENLSQLIEEVKNGIQEHAIKLFDLYGNDLSFLKESDQNIIYLYLYSYIGTFRAYGENENLKQLQLIGIIKSLAKGSNISNEVLQLQLKLMRSIASTLHDVEDDSDKYSYREVFKDLELSLSKQELTKFYENLKREGNYSRFMEVLNDDELLPF